MGKNHGTPISWAFGLHLLKQIYLWYFPLVLKENDFTTGSSVFFLLFLRAKRPTDVTGIGDSPSAARELKALEGLHDHAPADPGIEPVTNAGSMKNLWPCFPAFLVSGNGGG